MDHKQGIRKRLRLSLRLPERLRVRPKGRSAPAPGLSATVKSWLGLAWSLFGVGLFAMVALIVTLQVREDVILIEELGVPEELAKQGWTGRAVAKGLLDELQHIQSNATTRMERVPFSSSWSVQSPDVVVAGTSVPLSALVRHLRNLFGVTMRQVDGEVALEGEEIHLTARVNGSEGRTFTETIGGRGKGRTMKRLLASAAKYVLEETEPYFLASFYCNTDDRRCLPTIERCLSNSSTHDDSWAYNLWGIVVMGQSPQEASSRFQRAIALDPEFDLPYRNWGRLLLNQGKTEEARKVLEKALELRPDAIAHSNLGFALLVLKHPSAIKEFERAIELEPRYPNAHLGLGIYQETFRKDRSKAHESFREAILMGPDFDPAYEYLLPFVKDPQEAQRLEKERLRRAELNLRRIVEANPESGRSRCKLASFLESRFRYEEAEAELRAAIEVEDTLAEAHDALGRLLLRYRRYDDAIDRFWRATDLDPNLAVAYSNWGRALSELGDHEQALARFQKAVSLDPSSDNHLNVGVSLYRLNRLEEALSELREARKKSPGSRIAIQNGCLVARKLGLTDSIREFCAPSQVRSASGTLPSVGAPVPLPVAAEASTVPSP